METQNVNIPRPSFGNSFGRGWQVMTDNFLRLLLVVFVLAILTAPMKCNYNMDGQHIPLKNLSDMPWEDLTGSWGAIFGVASLGALAIFLGLLVLLYSFLAAPVIDYGARLIFVRAVRNIKPDFELLIKGFWENYLHIILANLLVFSLVIIGLFALIIPGIVIGCRLAFTSYLVMDKKLDPIEAVEKSWKLTRGHGWRIFLMGIASFFIFIFGLILMFIGVFPAVIWIKSSFAALYESVLNEKEPVQAVAETQQ
ncbi:MAG: hypothetical protein RBU28_02010 [Bacteroidales bacterium]|jgi:hypothetical protein|nr:hypothetical protein [Bacteroidales bacterium]